MLTDSAAIGERGLRPALLRLNARLLSSRFERRHLASADRVVAVSHGVRGELEAAYGVRRDRRGRPERSRHRVLPPGPAQAGRGRRDSRTILYVGRLGYRKGLGRLLDAFALLAPGTDLELALAGEGPLNGRWPAEPGTSGSPGGCASRASSAGASSRPSSTPPPAS
jgi:glycosyltransferase involved in cell wall biosynthesis